MSGPPPETTQGRTQTKDTHTHTHSPKIEIKIPNLPRNRTWVAGLDYRLRQGDRHVIIDLTKFCRPAWFPKLLYITSCISTVVKLGLSPSERSRGLWCSRKTMLMKIFGAKRDVLTGEWRKLHNAELYALESSPIIIRNLKWRRLRWAGYVSHKEKSRNA